MHTDPEAKRIAESIDWNPTCRPGEEKRAIVEQILRAVAGQGAADVTARLHAEPERDANGYTLDHYRRWMSDIRAALGVDGTWNPVHVIEQWRGEVTRLRVENEQLRRQLAEARAERDDALVQTHDWLKAERDELQARIDKAVQEWHDATRPMGERLVRILTALAQVPSPTLEPAPQPPAFREGEVVRNRHTGAVLTVRPPLSNWLPFDYELVRPVASATPEPEGPVA